jgi:putative FmdB family regulatory protein
LPLYEYRCTSCGYRFEKIQKVTDAAETACPNCGGELVRPLTAPALQFKGAGWYVNDYASKPASSSGDKPAGESGAGSSDSKGSEARPSDSKPAAESKSMASDTSSKPAAS